MFKYFDIYDKGYVSFNDFMKAMEKIGLYYSPQEVGPLFERVYDTDGNGLLDYKEFSAIIFGNKDGLKGQQVKRGQSNTANTIE